jgi:hypothetical protein
MSSSVGSAQKKLRKILNFSKMRKATGQEELQDGGRSFLKTYGKDCTEIKIIV